MLSGRFWMNHTMHPQSRISPKHNSFSIQNPEDTKKVQYGPELRSMPVSSCADGPTHRFLVWSPSALNMKCKWLLQTPTKYYASGASRRIRQHEEKPLECDRKMNPSRKHRISVKCGLSQQNQLINRGYVEHSANHTFNST